MKRLILGLCALVIVGVACGGGGKRGGTQPTPVAVGAYAAARWIPDRASYAVTARTVREAQQAMLDLIDTFGMAADVSVGDVSRELTAVLRVDPLSADAAAQIGIDVEGGLAVFSDHLNPTVVVRLASAQAFQAFIDSQQLRMQSVVEDGVEVFTAPLPGRLRISWAVADGWLWVHVGLPFAPDDSATWFASSRKASAPAWAADLAAAKGSGEPPVVGFVDVARFLADASALVPEVGQCMSQLQLGASGIGRLGLALAADDKGASARLSLDVGAHAQAIAGAVMPVPEGWAAVTAQVPIAAQWNLDLAAVRARIDPCARLLGADLGDFDELGIRAARGFVRTFDPDGRDGTGAVAVDLSHKDFFAAQLDQIPMRSALERKRTFGPYAGKSLAIPMFLTVDYVLTDQLALAGVGDGLLVQLVGKGGTAPGPVAALAVQPLGLSLESWIELLQLAEVPDARRVAERLQRWREARVKLTIEGSRLVLSASGSRR